MKKRSRNLLLLIILTSGTQVIELPVGGFSIFQIVLIIAAVGILFDIINNRYIKRGRYLLIGICYIFSSILALMLSTYPSWARSYFLLGIMTAMIILVVPNLFTKSDILLLERTLIRSQYIAIPFSIYSFYMYYFRGGLPKVINLFAGLSISLDDDLIRRAQAASQVRLTLPYATPPVLSVVMAVCVVLLICNDELFEKKIRYTLIVIYAIILMFTGSRSGILGLVFSLGLWFLFDYRKKIKTRTTVLTGALILAVAVGILLYMSETTYFHKLYSLRSINIDLMSDRHFLVPLDGLIIWVGSIKNFVLGIGFGSSYNMTGVHTYLPPYFLNSFVTLVAERGILGLIIVIGMFSLLFASFSLIKRNLASTSIKALFYGYVCCMVSCMVYEVLNCYFVIFIVAIMSVQFVEDRSKKKRSLEEME